MFTAGRAWVPLNGTTRQEVGTGLFLLSEVKWRTSFSKSFTERSVEILVVSPAQEYSQRGDSHEPEGAAHESAENVR